MFPKVCSLLTKYVGFFLTGWRLACQSHLTNALMSKHLGPELSTPWESSQSQDPLLRPQPPLLSKLSPTPRCKLPPPDPPLGGPQAQCQGLRGPTAGQGGRQRKRAQAHQAVCQPRPRGCLLTDFLGNYFISTEQEESNSIIQEDTLKVIICVTRPAPSPFCEEGKKAKPGKRKKKRPPLSRACAAAARINYTAALTHLPPRR